MESKDSQGRADRETKRERRRGSEMRGGSGLVAGIATVVVVGVAGTLFSKLRKPKNQTHTNASLGKIISRDGQSSSQLLVQNDSKGTDMSAKTEKQGSLHEYLEEKTLAGFDDAISGDGDSNPAFTKLTEDDDSRINSVINETSTDAALFSDALFVSQHSKEIEFSSATALSELVNHALLDTKHESSSKNDLLIKTMALQEGIAEVISRAFEDFGCGDSSSDEQTAPAKLKLTVTWENSSDFEKGDANDTPLKSATESDCIAGRPVDPAAEPGNFTAMNSKYSTDHEPLVSAPDDLQVDSPKTDIDKQVDRTNPGPAPEDELSSDLPSAFFAVDSINDAPELLSGPAPPSAKVQEQPSEHSQSPVATEGLGNHCAISEETGEESTTVLSEDSNSEKSAASRSDTASSDDNPQEFNDGVGASLESDVVSDAEQQETVDERLEVQTEEIVEEMKSPVQEVQEGGEGTTRLEMEEAEEEVGASLESDVVSDAEQKETVDEMLEVHTEEIMEELTSPVQEVQEGGEGSNNMLEMEEAEEEVISLVQEAQPGDTEANRLETEDIDEENISQVKEARQGETEAERLDKDIKGEATFLVEEEKEKETEPETKRLVQDINEEVTSLVQEETNDSRETEVDKLEGLTKETEEEVASLVQELQQDETDAGRLEEIKEEVTSVVQKVQQGETEALGVKDGIEEIVSLSDDKTSLSLSAGATGNDLNRKCDAVSQDAVLSTVNEVGISVNVAEITLAEDEEMSIEVTAEKELNQVKVNSLVFPEQSSEVSNVTKVFVEVPTDSSKIATVISKEVTTKLTTSKTGNTTQESLRDRLPLEVLGMTVLIALIAVIVLMLHERISPSTQAV